MNGSLCIGDFITLVSEETGGFLSASPDSEAVSEISCIPNKQEKGASLDQSSKPAEVPNRNVVTFELCVPNKCRAWKELRTLRKGTSANARELLEAQKEVDREEEENEKLNISQRGRKIYYGQVIQLKSVSTQKYVSCVQKASVGAECVYRTVNLTEVNGRRSQFRLGPSIPNNSGGVVKDGDSLTIESMKDTDQFVHLISDSSERTNGRGVEIAATPSDFRICRTYRSTQIGIRTGEIIQIQHKRIDSLLVGISSDSSTSGEVFLQKTQNSTADTSTGGPGDPFNSFWQVDIMKSNDGILHRDNLCRLIHLSTQRFLCVDPAGQFKIVTDKSMGWTIFKLQSTTQNTDIVHRDSFVRIQNMEGKCWLCATKETVHMSKVKIEKESVFLGTAVPTDRCPCNLMHSSKTEQKADMFQIKTVDSKTLKNVSIVQDLSARTNTFIQKETHDGSTMAKGSKMTFLLDSIKELRQKLSGKRDQPSHYQIQNFICESGLLKHLFKVMEMSSSTPNNRTNDVYDEAANLILACIQGSSRGIKPYLTEHLDFCVQEAKNKESPMQAKALAILVGIFKDNEPLVSKTKDHHIDKIFDMFRMDGHYLYFKLLEALCVCNGVPQGINQTYITRKLTSGDDKKELCYLAFMGEHIGRKESAVYISPNSGRSTVELHDVYKNEDLRLHYTHQLEFFKVLCHGGNQQAARVLTTEVGLITFDLLSQSLMDERLAPENKAIYCHLLIVMFIEANKRPVFGHVPQAIDFTKLEQQQTPDYQMDQVIQWANAKISGNVRLVEEKYNLNTFLSAILDMVRSLFLHGCYGNNLSGQEHCVRGIVQLLEQPGEKQLSASDEAKDMDSTQTEETHYVPDPDGGISMVQISALNVIDCFFEKATGSLVMDCLSTFKESVLNGKKMYPDPYLETTKMESCINKRRILYPFDERKLRGILLDLARTGNECLAQKSMSSLTRCCSVVERMFENVKVVQLLNSDNARNDWKTIEAISSSLKKVLQSRHGSTHDRTKKDLNDLERLCYLTEGVPNPVNQMLIQNTGLLDVVFRQLESKTKPDGSLLRLMNAVTHRNAFVQELMFDHLDTLLDLSHIAPDAVGVMTEIFKDNDKIGTKTTSTQVKRMVNLLAQSKLTETLELLHVVVRPSPGCILKRNQRLILANIPTYRSVIMKCLSDPSSERIRRLNAGNQLNLAQILSLLDFLATLAQDEHRFRDTFCTDILLDEVHTVLASDVTVPIKIIYLRYLTSTFVSRERNTILQSDKTWNLISSFDSVLRSMEENVTKEPGLLQRCSTHYGSKRMSLKMEESVVIYVCEGILPFLKGLFRGQVTEVPKQFLEKLTGLDAMLQRFTKVILPYITDIPDKMSLLREVLEAVHRHVSASVDGDEYTNIINSFDELVRQPKTRSVLNQQSEIELNRHFQLFVNRWYERYRNGGKDVRSPYVYMELPQSLEFKELADCFSPNKTTNGGRNYEGVSAICTCLMVSPRTSLSKNVDGFPFTIKCFQVLRHLLQSEISQLGHVHWSKSKRQCGRLGEIQNILVQHDCVACVFYHLKEWQGHHEVSNQAFALLSDLLYNRNKAVEVAIVKYMTSVPDDTFFRTVHTILTRGIDGYKYRKPEWASKSKKKEEKQTGTSSKGANSGHVKRFQVEPIVDPVPKKYQEHKPEVDTSNPSFVMTVRMLGNMADSCDLQNLIRTQPLNSHSYNLVSDCTILMKTLYMQLDRTNIAVYTDIVGTLTALVSGNAENQSTVVDNNGIEAISYIITTKELSNCSLKQVLEVKLVNAMLARSLIEMNHDVESKHADLPKMIADQLDTATVGQDINEMWKSIHSRKTAENKRIEFGDSKYKAIMKQLCRQYYLLLVRAMDLGPEDEALIHGDENRKTISIELAKEGTLQRHYSVREMQMQLTKAMKETFYETVDRSSAGSKVRGLVSWTAGLAKRVSRRTEIAEVPFGELYMKSWILLNALLMFFTVVLVTFLSFGFSAPNLLSVIRFRFDRLDYDVRHADKVLYTLGGVHNVLSTLVLVYFVVMEEPSIPAAQHIATVVREKATGTGTYGYRNNWSDRFREDRSEVIAFHIKSIYYVLLFLFSIAGTLFDGYFFSFHLFHMIVLSTSLQKLFRVLRGGVKLLAMLGLLLLAMVYAYSVFLCVFYPNYLSDRFSQDHTTNIFQTFASFLHHGLIERDLPNVVNAFKEELKSIGFDLMFFVTVTVLCLYLALGIIIDSFATLRAKQELAKQDDAARCFICNMKSEEFDLMSGGFQHHVKREHNIWNYMRFLIELDLCNPAQMTGLERFVMHQLRNNCLDFFPVKTLVSLPAGVSDSDLADKMHHIELRMADIGARLNKDSEPTPSSLRTNDRR